jgi:DNA repair exonuclease SbcCD ATPase subunit
LALTKERNAHQQAQNQRDSLRQDLNRLLSEYRSRQGTVEQQIQEIDKLNVVINNLEKEMLQLKTRYEHAVEERNITGVQLIDRNDELCILYERSNQQLETLKKGELVLIKLEENIRLLRLYYEELNRKYIVAKNKIPFRNNMEKKIVQLKQELEKETKLTEEFSAKLEDPGNLSRWRPLEGTDLDLEQLIAKIQILEKRLDEKRESVLEKELILEEITNLTEKLRNQALSKRENAKLLADELNDLHSKIREVTKKMLASVSELSMYQVVSAFCSYFLFIISFLLIRLLLCDYNKKNYIERSFLMMQHGNSITEKHLRNKRKFYFREPFATI